jgi:hypothetical protein
MEFVAIDVETANADMASICQIGIAQFKGGTLAQEWKTYVDPFLPSNLMRHGKLSRSTMCQRRRCEMYCSPKMGVENKSGRRPKAIAFLSGPIWKRRCKITTASFGVGGSTKMHKQQAAGPAVPAHTGKVQTAVPGSKRAVGGPRTTGVSLSKPAAAGHTSPVRKGR